MSLFDKEEIEEILEIPELHRNDKLDGEGVSQVSVARFVKYLLPFLLRVKEEMDQGRLLTDGELELMTRMVDRAHNINRFVYEHPELKTLVAEVIDLVHDITGQALANANKHKD
jgi:hypothetical protein